jgi:magnesium chelatase subunit D
VGSREKEGTSVAVAAQAAADGARTAPATAGPYASAPPADPHFPFSAVLGQDDLRLALILNAIHPGVGGVLARGEKGTAKSTLVRALAAVLPPVCVVSGCRFACDPAAPDPRCPDGPHLDDDQAQAESRRARLVELPVGASEDRLTGSLDLERALGQGVAAFQPGLLAAAHRGMLYVDEVNLLPDHLVDVLLDAAAMGVAHVERDGVSVRHAARFILVGTMNPEEGELRPQLLDRFGLTVEVAASREPKQRAEIVRRRLAYEADPAAFATAWAQADQAVGERIAQARAALGSVDLPDAELERIARVCAAFEVDGMRADLVTARAAVALAAWRGLPAVTAAEVRDAARLALPHRRRRNPFDAPGLDEDKLDEALRDQEDDDPPPDSDPDGPGDGDGPAEPEEISRPDINRPTQFEDGAGPDGQAGRERQQEAGEGSEAGEQSGDGKSRDDAEKRRDENAAEQSPRSSADDQSAGPTSTLPAPEQAAVAPSDPYRTKLYAVPGVGEGVPGRRSAGRSFGRGRVVGAEAARRLVSSLHLPATVRAAAARQAERGRSSGPLLLRAEDLRTPIRRDREGNLVLFVVDASGSMAARARMAAVKGAVLSLLLDAYQRRDKVGMVTFRGNGAEVALPPTTSVEAAAARLRALPTGGRTPLAAGLLAAAEVVRRERLRDPRRRPLLVVVTDGRATSANSGSRGAQAEVRRIASHLAASGIASIVVDCEAGAVRLGLAEQMAAQLSAEHVPMADLAAAGQPDTLAATVRATLDPLRATTALTHGIPGIERKAA